MRTRWTIVLGIAAAARSSLRTPGQTLRQHPMKVITQAHAFDPNDPADAQYVENVMWQQGKTEFVTLNIAGGSNNDTDPWYASHKIPASPAQQTGLEQRPGGDIRWLNAAFASAEKDESVQNVVIIGQPDMWDAADTAAHQTNYEPIIAAMVENAAFFKKPVLYLNGDSHLYRSDNPPQQGAPCLDEETSGAPVTTCTKDAWEHHPFYNVPNFHRVVVHGSTFPLEWLKLTIDEHPTQSLTSTQRRGGRSAGCMRPSRSWPLGTSELGAWLPKSGQAPKLQ
jgi:hypothetical protein